MLIFFHHQNGRAFPLLLIAALLPRGWRGAETKECGLGGSGAARVFLQHR